MLNTLSVNDCANFKERNLSKIMLATMDCYRKTTIYIQMLCTHISINTKTGVRWTY